MSNVSGFQTLGSNPDSKCISVLGEKSCLHKSLIDELIFRLASYLEHGHTELTAVLLRPAPGVEVVPTVQAEVQTVVAVLRHVENAKVINFLLADKAKLLHLISGLPES